MKYQNAKDVLPKCLIQEIQKYVQGGYIYIPSKQKKHWGENSGYKVELKKRNMKIIDEYQQGCSLEYLADKYYLSIHSIRKIIYQK